MRSYAAAFCAALFVVFAAGLASAQSGGGTWHTLVPMPTSRQEVAAAVLDGKLYVLGGLGGGESWLDTVAVYNPNTNTWSQASRLPFPNHHNAAAVAAGKLYSFGGVARQAFVYDQANNSWSRIADPLYQHGLMAAVGVWNDKIYVLGGTHGTASIRELEVYDPARIVGCLRA